MTKEWIINEKKTGNAVTVLASQLNIDPVLANLLVQRGVNTYDEARLFFSPSFEDLHDPFLMKDMDKAVARIEKALTANEKILVYGDYDVDGTTSVAMVYSFLKKRHSQVHYYIPDRYLEGYGISFKGIDYAANNGYSLVIALDCGIKAVEKINYANSKNLDFIICDHHLPGSEIPNAVAVLDAKQPGCTYPYKELSGCGVGFKLIWAYAQKNNLDIEEVKQYIDLVLVSIASDIVPITGENRILARFGLERLNKNPSTGLNAIKIIAGIETAEVSINDIVFKIGPRINAAGRIETGSKAVDLLICSETATALSLARDINSCNDQRKNLDQSIFHEALEMVKKSPEKQKQKTTVLYNPNWHKGVIGIVASRLIDHYYRPTIILTKSNGIINGSARTVDGFDLYKAIDSCSDLLETYGGHMFAAGLSMKPENLDKFTRRFEDYVESTISADQLIPRLEIDDVINFSHIDDKFVRILERFQPFGPGNMTPLFVTNGVKDTGYGRTVGKNNEHLKLDLKQGAGTGNVFGSIAFQMGHLAEETASSDSFDICFSIERNEFMNKSSIQLRIRDIKLGQDS